MSNKQTISSIRNIEQLDANLKVAVSDIKQTFSKNFGYIPKISECLYIYENMLNSPLKCRRETCVEHAKFNRNQYMYCSRQCSDKDPNRNKKIQEKRSILIDYVEVSKKTNKTKSETIIDGKNIHQRTGGKISTFYNNNPDLRIQQSIRQKRQTELYTEDDWNRIYEKRIAAMIANSGQSHAGGGFSKLRTVKIFNIDFIVQGYEDVFIYEQLSLGIAEDDIILCSRLKEFSIKYLYNGKMLTYFPDFFIRSENKFYEIKSVYWWERELEKNKAKINSMRELDQQIEVKIYDEKTVRDVRKRIEATKDSSRVCD